MNSSKSKRTLKLSRKYLVLIALIIAAVAVGAAIPLMATNNTEKYSGAQLKAAQFVLDHDRSQELSAKIMKAQIESVVASPQGTGSTGKPLRCTDNPQDEDYYTVTIKHISLFGITYDKREYNICRMFGWPR